MTNRLGQAKDEGSEREDARARRASDAILAELLAQYQVRFPCVHIVVVETRAA